MYMDSSENLHAYEAYASEPGSNGGHRHAKRGWPCASDQRSRRQNVKCAWILLKIYMHMKHMHPKRVWRRVTDMPSVVDPVWVTNCQVIKAKCQIKAKNLLKIKVLKHELIQLKQRGCITIMTRKSQIEISIKIYEFAPLTLVAAPISGQQDKVPHSGRCAMSINCVIRFNTQFRLPASFHQVLHILNYAFHLFHSKQK